MAHLFSAKMLYKPNNKRATSRQVSVAILVASVTTGCVPTVFGGYGAQGLSRDEFVHYVEQVFRLQNTMTSEIMALVGSGEEEGPQLMAAEQQMRHMCADLNEYVSRDIDGLHTSLFLRRRVEQSAMSCEKAALVVGNLLKNQPK